MVVGDGGCWRLAAVTDRGQRLSISVFFFSPLLRLRVDEAPMAMQSGLSSSKVLILMGAGLTGSIVLRNGRLSDVISELQELFKGVNEAEVSSNHYDASLLAAQIRHLAQEVRTLTLSRPVTILNGESTSNGTLASYLLPAAAVGAMGYCYMWWKGWSISDVMFVTKRNMANAVANVSKQLEQVSAALAMTKRHLTQRLEKLDYKLDEQKETVETIMKEVHGVKTDLSQIGFDIEEIQNLLSGLEGKMELLENKQDATNLGISYLCQISGGIKDGLHTKFVQEAIAKLGSSYPSLSFLEAEPRQGLQFLAESLKPREAESIGIKTQQTDANISFKKPLIIRRFYQSGISLKKDGLLAL